MKTPDLTLRRIHGEIAKMKKELPLYTKSFHVDSNDPFNMYFLIEPKTEPYTGQYILHVKLPGTYPLSAPQIEMLTPNGRFIPNKWICTNFSHYHPEEHNCILSISTLVYMCVEYMLNESLRGIGIMAEQTIQQKKAYANNSQANNRDIMKQKDIIFEEFGDAVQ